MIPERTLAAFFALKRRLDPCGTFESDLWRRVAPERLRQNRA
jgi:hypothetical protein